MREVTSDLKSEISLLLDGVTTWVDLSRYPKFNSLTIVPDPFITKFLDDVYVLKTPTLEIKV